MIVLLIGNKSLYKMELPTNIEGSFVLSDPKTKNNLFNIDAENDNWALCGNDKIKLLDSNNQSVNKAFIKNDAYFFIEYEKEKKILYCVDTYDETHKNYKVEPNTKLVFGSDKNCDVIYSNPYIKPNHLTLTYSNDGWLLETLNGTFIYLNDQLIQSNQQRLCYGDQLFTYGLKICVMNGYITINKPSNATIANTQSLQEVTFGLSTVDKTKFEEVNEENLYTDDDYYFNTPRLRRFVETFKLSFAQPPAKQPAPETSLLLTLGPSLTMAFTSLLTAYLNISRIVSGKVSLKDGWPGLITPVVMLVSSLVWPTISRRIQKKNAIKKEKIREEKYRKYIQEKREAIEKEKTNQSAIIKENLLTLEECYNIIVNKKRTLWERKINQKDFLTIRVGTGTTTLDMEVNWNENEFEIEKDSLLEEAGKVVDEAKMLYNVPIGYSFFDKKATALMGNMDKVRTFTKDMLLQLMTFHSYDELKIVIFTDDENKEYWEPIKTLPHLFSDDKSIRFFGISEDEQKDISDYLEQEFIKRVNSDDIVENENETDTYSPYYLILTDNYMKIRKLGICDKVFATKEDYGFSFVILEKRISHLPSKCVNFIMIDNTYCGILRNELNDYYQQEFQSELDDSFDLSYCSRILSNIPIEFEQDTRYLPNSLSFLDMYGVGKIEQLNIFNRWRMNDSTKSLRAPIGVNDQGNLIYLDLHEKYAGPHGLIAGTTGSGKSEFIITYILSMCVNYSPNEVSFILIDYKGGGLAGAFENKKNGFRLPHLAGTITNLDKNELNRTLVSIQSELTRRQSIFNEARDELGESTIDIYKYQRFFSEGKLKKPMPHLFIICDEFAELKQQQPEFMENLISTARIGRSLGVHLILATQKPSGVVDEQIWSNTKFRVCLKVANPSDSNEVIKCPDAAEIKNAGRFILQVGQNEIFVLGQSGWTGANYAPSDIVKQEYDRSISYIDDVGNVIKNVRNESQNKKQSASIGDELSNILKYVDNIARKENIRSESLWLDAIPSNLSLPDVVNKYNFNDSSVTAIIGEYDDPSNQRQDILKLPLDENGNTIIYGLTASYREMMLRTIIYSTAIKYSSSAVNFYIIDFGSETFKIFSKFPHVGDVVFQSEVDKFDKLLKMLDEEIITRKNLFADYNGEYSNYCKNSGRQVPLYTIIINNYDILREQFAAYEELILKLTREGKRYGIIFIIATTSQSGLFSRFLKNFDNEFVLDMNDKSEYMDILGRIGNIYPAEVPGRGLFKKDGIYEFQVAFICDEDSVTQFIKDEASKLQQTNTYHAKPVPVLPDTLTLEMITESDLDLKHVPLGMDKDLLKPVTYSFHSNKSLLISSNELENMKPVLKYLLQTFMKIGNIVNIVFDFESEYEFIKPYCNNYIASNYENYLEQSVEFIKQKISNTNYNVIFTIIGLDNFREKVSADKLNKFKDEIKKIENCKIVFIDTTYSIKKLAFESWYTELVQNNNGLWVGNGIMDQSAIKISTYEKKYNTKISNDFGWYVKNGEGTLIKLINGDSDEE